MEESKGLEIVAEDMVLSEEKKVVEVLAEILSDDGLGVGSEDGV